MKRYLVFTRLGHSLGEIEAENLCDALQTARDYYGIVAYTVEEIK